MLKRVVVLPREFDNQLVETRVLSADLLLEKVGALSQVGTNIMHGCASPGNTHKPCFRRRALAKKAAGRSSTDQFEFSRLCTEAGWLGARRQAAKTACKRACFEMRRRLGMGGVDPRQSCAQT